jgi:hypothetical protein
MVAQQQIGPIRTVDRYLVLERYSTVTHEYDRGYVDAMAGGRLRRHPRYRGARRVVGSNSFAVSTRPYSTLRGGAAGAQPLYPRA